MAGDERRAADRRRLRGDHAEGFGEDRRHDARVGECQQVPEVPVLERPREDRVDPAFGGPTLERRPLGPEADDDEAGLHTCERIDQDVNALLLDQLPEVDDDRWVGREETLESRGIALVGQPLLPVPGVRQVASRLVDQSVGRGLARLWRPLVDIDAGRDLEDVLGVSTDLGEDGADVLGPDERGPGTRERLRPPRRQLRVAAHGVLELRSVRLDRERRTARCADRAAEEDMIREDDIGGQEIPDGAGIGLHPPLELRPRAVLDASHVVPVVAIEDEYRQQAA